MAIDTDLSTEVHEDHHDDHSHAHPEDGPVVSRNIYERNSLSLTFAFVAGAGLVLMLLAGIIGVINGSSADSDMLGVMFAAGALAMLTGAATWASIVRPWEEFPSVTEGYYDHPDAVAHANHDEHQDDHAMVSHEAIPHH